MKKKDEIQKLALELQNKWMKDHNDWKTPVWGYFRDEAERILEAPPCPVPKG